MVQYRAILIVDDQQKAVYGLSNDAIFNDLWTTPNPAFKVTSFFDAK